MAGLTPAIVDVGSDTEFVEMLWVAPEHRRQGYGRQLANAALEMAQSLGCHSARLDTSSPAAFTIWKRLGLSEFACLANTACQHPAEHRRLVPAENSDLK